MSRIFMSILALHVVVAVLGLGSTLSVALVSSAVRSAGRDACRRRLLLLRETNQPANR